MFACSSAGPSNQFEFQVFVLRWCHGLGADEEELAPLLDRLSLRDLVRHQVAIALAIEHSLESKDPGGSADEGPLWAKAVWYVRSGQGTSGQGACTRTPPWLSRQRSLRQPRLRPRRPRWRFTSKRCYGFLLGVGTDGRSMVAPTVDLDTLDDGPPLPLPAEPPTESSTTTTQADE